MAVSALARKQQARKELEATTPVRRKKRRPKPEEHEVAFDPSVNTRRKDRTEVIRVSPSDEDRPRKKKRRRTVEEQVDDVVKQSTGLTKKRKPVDPEKRKQKLSENTENALSKFKGELEAAQDLIKGDSDKAFDGIHAATLRMLIDLVPIAEENYRRYRNERSAYALNALISQSRELIADMQATSDRKNLSTELAYTVVKPALYDIMQMIIDSQFRLKKVLDSYIQPDKAQKVNDLIDSNAKDIGRYLEGIFARVAAESRDLIDGD